MAKYVSEDGVKAIRDWVKVHDNKSLYNLGYYDTYDASTNTITRQTGYIVLDGVNNKFRFKSVATSNGIYYINYVNDYIEKPSSSLIIGNIICNRFETRSINNLWNNSVYGIGIHTNGEIWVGLTTAISTLNEANAYLVQNPISIQYKLATATTERVEKNHYARYNERFILEHNKSEAERSSNLLEVINSSNININGTNVNINNGTITVSGTATQNGGRTYKFSDVISLEPGTYWFKAFGNITSTPWLSKIDNSGLVDIGHMFTITEPTQVYFGINVIADATYNESYQVMLVKGSTPPAKYQPYNQNKHITNNEALFLKTESDRSANLLTDNVFADKRAINNITYTANGSIITINTTDTNDPYLYFKNCFTLDKKTTITLSLDNYNNIQMCGIVTSGTTTPFIGVDNKPITITLEAGTYGIGFETLNVGTNTYKVMLNEGSTPLPYQPYEGKVVHEKDINRDIIIKALTANGETIPTFYNGVKVASDGNDYELQVKENGFNLYDYGESELPYELTLPFKSGRIALLSDVPSIYGVSQLYRHDIEFDILNGDGIKCTFWSTSNVKITDFSQIPYLAFSNIQVKNISNEKILNVVQWNSDGFRFYESDGTSTLIGDGYDGVTAYYINGEPTTY